jgi:hypothetical protein
VRKTTLKKDAIREEKIIANAYCVNKLLPNQPVIDCAM